MEKSLNISRSDVYGDTCAHHGEWNCPSVDALHKRIAKIENYMASAPLSGGSQPVSCSEGSSSSSSNVTLFSVLQEVDSHCGAQTGTVQYFIQHAVDMSTPDKSNTNNNSSYEIIENTSMFGTDSSAVVGDAAAVKATEVCANQETSRSGRYWDLISSDNILQRLKISLFPCIEKETTATMFAHSILSMEDVTEEQTSTYSYLYYRALALAESLANGHRHDLEFGSYSFGQLFPSRDSDVRFMIDGINAAAANGTAFCLLNAGKASKRLTGGVASFLIAMQKPYCGQHADIINKNGKKCVYRYGAVAELPSTLPIACYGAFARPELLDSLVELPPPSFDDFLETILFIRECTDDVEGIGIAQFVLAARTKFVSSKVTILPTLLETRFGDNINPTTKCLFQLFWGLSEEIRTGELSDTATDAILSLPQISRPIEAEGPSFVREPYHPHHALLLNASLRSYFVAAGDCHSFNTFICALTTTEIIHLSELLSQHDFLSPATGGFGTGIMCQWPVNDENSSNGASSSINNSSSSSSSSSGSSTANTTNTTNNNATNNDTFIDTGGAFRSAANSPNKGTSSSTVAARRLAAARSSSIATAAAATAGEDGTTTTTTSCKALSWNSVRVQEAVSAWGFAGHILLTCKTGLDNVIDILKGNWQQQCPAVASATISATLAVNLGAKSSAHFLNHNYLMATFIRGTADEICDSLDLCNCLADTGNPILDSILYEHSLKKGDRCGIAFDLLMERLIEGNICPAAVPYVFRERNAFRFDPALDSYDSLVSYRQYPHWISASIVGSILGGGGSGGGDEGSGNSGDRSVHTCGYNSTHQITETLMSSLQQGANTSSSSSCSSPWRAVVAAAAAAVAQLNSNSSAITSGSPTPALESGSPLPSPRYSRYRTTSTDYPSDNNNNNNSAGVSTANILSRVSLVDVVALCTCAAWQRGTTMDLALNFDCDIGDDDDDDDFGDDAFGRSDAVFVLPETAGVVRNCEMLPDICIPVPIILFYMLDGIQKSCGGTISMYNTRSCLQAPVASVRGRCVRIWEQQQSTSSSSRLNSKQTSPRTMSPVTVGIAGPAGSVAATADVVSKSSYPLKVSASLANSLYKSPSHQQYMHQQLDFSSPRAVRNTLCTASFNDATHQLSARTKVRAATLSSSICRRYVPCRSEFLGLSERLGGAAGMTAESSYQQVSVTEKLRMQTYFTDMFVEGGDFYEAMKFSLGKHALHFLTGNNSNLSMLSMSRS